MTTPAPSKELVLTVLTQYYLRSGGFNGMSAVQLAAALKATWQAVMEPIRQLVMEDMIGILGEGTDLDTHILRIGFPARDMQLAQIGRPPSPHTCIYPRRRHLETVVKKEMYSDRPYRLGLALGEPQMTYRVFDLSVLDHYRNHPRYQYHIDDFGGRICAIGDRAAPPVDPENEKALLKTFGFAYDAELNRFVAVFLRHLAVLPPKHQLLWKEKEQTGKFELCPDYFRTSALGEQPEGGSIYAAVLTEIRLINELAHAMGRPELFYEQVNGSDERPPGFSYLVRPTQKEFSIFIHSLDRMLSESICRDFFDDEVRSETDKLRIKGPLEMLVDWGARVFPPSKVDPWLQACRALRKVRWLRQRPEPSSMSDEFDQSFVKQQRELMISTYKSLRVLREMMARHPDATKARLNVPRWIQNGRIWSV